MEELNTQPLDYEVRPSIWIAGSLGLKRKAGQEVVQNKHWQAPDRPDTFYPLKIQVLSRLRILEPDSQGSNSAPPCTSL